MYKNKKAGMWLKKAVAIIAVAASTLSAPVSSIHAATSSPVVAPQAATSTGVAPYYAKVKKQISLYDTTKSGTCAIRKVNSKAKEVTFSKITIANGTLNGKPANVKIKYTCTKVKSGAFATAKKVKKATFGASIKKYEPQSFTGANALTQIGFKTSNISIDKHAFDGLNKKNIIIRFPKGTSAAQMKKLKALFKSMGFKNSNIRKTKLW